METIKINNIDYKIEDRDYWLNNGDNVSAIHINRGLLSVLSELPVQRYNRYLMELVSRILIYETFWPEDPGIDHQQFGNTLYSFMRSNEVRSWLLEEDNIPNRVVIRDLVYDVIISEKGDQFLDATDCTGQIKQGQLKIFILSGIPEQRKKAVLLHEITHGLLHEAGLEDHDDDKIVRPLTNMLHNFFLDNDFSFLR